FSIGCSKVRTCAGERPARTRAAAAVVGWRLVISPVMDRDLVEIALLYRDMPCIMRPGRDRAGYAMNSYQYSGRFHADLNSHFFGLRPVWRVLRRQRCAWNHQ